MSQCIDSFEYHHKCREMPHIQPFVLLNRYKKHMKQTMIDASLEFKREKVQFEGSSTGYLKCTCLIITFHLVLISSISHTIDLFIKYHSTLVDNIQC